MIQDHCAGWIANLPLYPSISGGLGWSPELSWNLAPVIIEESVVQEPDIKCTWSRMIGLKRLLL